ncbi:MAG: L,D-transpeptidase [Erythrobacter sp.]|nr:L,D-transpeptidase [Erythrobacter sp.]
MRPFKPLADISRVSAAFLALGLTTVAHAAQSGQAPVPEKLAQAFELSVPEEIPAAVFDGQRSEEILTVQVLLDRSRHSPGVIDGIMGGNTSRAVRYYRKTHGLPVSGKIDSVLMRSLISTQTGDVFRTYTISEDDVDGPFYPAVSGFSQMARMERVGWVSPAEMLADRFHMDRDLLAALNPEADFSRAGTRITIISHGDEQLPSRVQRIEIRKADDAVVALDAAGTILASYPATIGSEQFPSPSGTMRVAAVAPQANYTFTPAGREWGPDQTLVIPPGPNNPVGGIWIDLTREGYGIHGSPDPQLIGKTASHGCVRLTNWDAQELAGAIGEGVEVVFR